jgi:hypothetical protein
MDERSGANLKKYRAVLNSFKKKGLIAIILKIKGSLAKLSDLSKNQNYFSLGNCMNQVYNP